MTFFENPVVSFYLIFALALLLLFIPVIGKYLKVVETMVHEAGHVLVSLILGCPIGEVNLFADTSGVTTIKAGNGKTFFIALAGYPFSAFCAFLSFWAIDRTYYFLFLIVLSVFAFLFLIIYVRNAYGIFWVITFLVLNVLLFYFGGNNLIRYGALFFASVLFIESLLSAYSLLLLSFRTPNKAGDATTIAHIIHLPAPLIGLLFFAVTIVIEFYTVRYFFPLT